MGATTKNPETIELSALLQQAVNNKLMDSNFCLPGVVVSYDRSKQTAKIQPALKRKYTNGTVVDLPIINSVPVVFPRSKERFIHFDLEQGDYVTLVFSQRSLDTWKEKGGVVSPDDPRKFHLSDAYAIPGGYPKPESFSPNGAKGSIELTNGDSFMVLEQDGQITHKTQAGEHVIKADGEAIFTNDKVTVSYKPDGTMTLDNGKGLCSISPDGDFVFSNDLLEFTLKKTGKVTITNPAAELIAVLDDTLAEIIAARTVTLLGLQPLVGLNQTFPSLKTLLASFRE